MIDTHIHVVMPNLPGLKPVPEDYLRLMEAPPDAMAERLRAEMKEAGVTAAFGMGKLDPPADDPLGINGTLRLSTLVPGLKAVGAIDPRKTDPAHLSAVERQVERERGKLVAFKAYLGYLHFGPNDPGYIPYYRIAEKHRIPVIFHAGDNWSTKAKVRFAHPLLVDDAAVDHPGVSFVIAHFGNPWLIDAAEVVYKNDNVWVDLSGLFVGDSKTIETRTAEKTSFDELRPAFAYTERPDRFLYGSDWPLAPMGAYRSLIAALIPKEHHSAVFRENAEKLFGIKE